MTGTTQGSLKQLPVKGVPAPGQDASDAAPSGAVQGFVSDHSKGSADVPGDNMHLTTKVLGAGSSALEKFAPLKNIHEHVDGFHFYSHDMSRQVEAHHYCSHLNEEVRQCVIYDSDEPGARLIGIEYIISRRLFEGLPEEEKIFWHSHVYEVSSGMLICPHLPQPIEKQAMKTLIDTYGKTWHKWQVDRGDQLPMGPPQLMMAFKKDGQVDPGLLAKRDERYGRSTADNKAARADLEYPETIAPGADHWEGGMAWQVYMEYKELFDYDPVWWVSA